MLKCNKCGKKIKKDIPEDILVVDKEWGYFSNKDGERHNFIVCEKCYDEWVESFCVPINVEENTELI